MNSSFVGLDMSLTHSGIAIKTGDDIALHTVKTKPKDFINSIVRYDHIVSEVLALIPKTTKLLVIEDFFIPTAKARFSSAINLIALGTLIRKALNDAQLYFIVVSAKQCKKFATGTGAASKALVVREMNKVSSDVGKDDNLADSLGMALLAETIYRLREGLSLEGLTVDQVKVAQRVWDFSVCYNMPINKE